MKGRETQRDDGWASVREAGEPVPGLVLVFSRGAPLMRAFPVGAKGVVLGRDDCGGEPLDDERVSREHAEVRWDGAAWTVRDLGSRNGTFVDGAAVDGRAVAAALRVLRIGQSLLLPLGDVRAHLGATVERDGGRVAGPTLSRALERVTRAARLGASLLITGESGSGKELAARAFHQAGPRPAAPFIAVNCAAIPEGVAERLLFGARKGAFSGATADVEGYIQAADGGTLFLDEVGELDLAVQAKLLRVLEAREVLPLGAARARPVDLRFCSATHRDLRAAVADGSFRANLFFRIGQPEVALPPLRDRPEEIAFLVTQELAALDAKLVAHAALVELCLLRAWPGNVRELVHELRRAGGEALFDGGSAVLPEHLGERAGVAFGAAPAASAVPEGITRAGIEAELARQGGNVTAAARVLGVHRTHLYRLMKRHGILRSGDPGDEEG